MKFCLTNHNELTKQKVLLNDEKTFPFAYFCITKCYYMRILNFYFTSHTSPSSPFLIIKHAAVKAEQRK